MSADDHGASWVDDLPPLPEDSEASSFVGPVELTESDVAYAFTRTHQGRALFDHHVGSWFLWDARGGLWREDERCAIVEKVRKVVITASDAVKPGDRKKARSRSFIRGAESLAQSDPVHSVTSEVWDQDQMLLGCPGATVDLRTGEARPPDPRDRITRQAAVVPDLNGDCPTWHEFLNFAAGEDEALIAFLQKFAGYSLTGSTKAHVALWLHGEGGNGKSVFLNTLRGVLGTYAQAASMDTFCVSKYAQHPTDIASMRGARLVIVNEIAEGRNLDEQLFKKVTGGDPLWARRMREDGFEFIPQFKLLFAGNSRPVIRTVDDAMKRRLRMVEFNRKPERPDPELEGKLKAEWPGILRWMIRGCQAWLEEGLGLPDAVAEATGDYFGAQDIFAQWLQERCHVEPGNRNVWAGATELFADWRKWAEAAGEFAGTQTRFGERLASRGFIKERQRIAGVLVRGWIGVRLLGDRQ